MCQHIALLLQGYVHRAPSRSLAQMAPWLASPWPAVSNAVEPKYCPNGSLLSAHSSWLLCQSLLFPCRIANFLRAFCCNQSSTFTRLRRFYRLFHAYRLLSRRTEAGLQLAPIVGAIGGGFERGSQGSLWARLEWRLKRGTWKGLQCSDPGARGRSPARSCRVPATDRKGAGRRPQAMESFKNPELLPLVWSHGATIQTSLSMSSAQMLDCGSQLSLL